MSDVDVDEVYEQLRAAVDRGSRDLAATRGLAERFWAVSADVPLQRRPGPKGWLAFQVKRVLRKAMRWYVEPALAEQRMVNDALLRLVDDLARRVDELESRS
ncbi:MAG TPA: hypothetical protein VFJ91_01055 [Gaiellaceae bacterium]|nr:hypothetical protein [Gaiellaceae bacterium]